MEVGILGPLLVTRQGSEVMVGAAKQRALLTLLVLRRGEAVPTETLVDELWNGRPPATATKIVHGYVSQLRRALGDGVLDTLPGGYRLRLASEDLDAGRFEALLEDGRRQLAEGDPDHAAATLRVALALWRGPPLVEVRFQDFAADEIRRLDELRLLALEYRLEADVAVGNHATAIPEMRALIREHPVRETLHRLLMLALYRAGRQTEALAAYQDARKMLVEELGLEPGKALQNLEVAILAHDPALDLQTMRAGGPPGGEPPVDHAVRTARRRPIRRWAVFIGMAAGTALAVTSVVALVPQGGARSAATALSTDSVGFIDARGNRVSRQIAIDGEPSAVAAGAGAIWVVDTAAGTVRRIDPASHAVVQTIAVGLDPGGIAVGGGSVWVANHDDNTVSRISPETNAVVRTVPVGVGPVAVAFGYGSVWVTNGADRTLTRLDAATGAVSATIRTNAVGRGVAVGGGAVWVTDEATGRIVGVDPATDAVTSAATVGTGPTAIAYGSGAVWVVNALDSTVSRVDAATLTVQSTIPVPGGPSAISFADGAVWVSDEFASRVVRIDPVRAVITASTVIGNRPEGLVATAGGVWVAVQASGAGHRGGRLVVVGGDVTSVDPAVGDLFPALNEPAYDALTSLRHDSGPESQIVPDLATTLPQPTADGTSYTFHLRPQIRYSDGRLLQAADFRRGLERLLALHGSFAPSFSHIIGAADCSESRCDLSPGVIVEGTSAVTIRLSSPDPRLFWELQYLIPVPAGTPTHDVGAAPVPGTGPYAIESYVPGHLLTFRRNRYFHVWSEPARPGGYPDEIVYRVVADENNGLHQLLTGQADLVHLFSETPALSELAALHPRQVHLVDEQSLVFVFLNTRRPPFDDVRVRRALNYAVDRERVVELYGADLARPACQVVPSTSTGYRAYCPYTLDPDSRGRWSAPDLARAQSLVDASGTKGSSVVLWAFPDFVSEANYVAGVLDRLGYHASVHEIADAGTYFETLGRTPGVQAGMFGWFGNPLAVDMLSTLTCGFDLNPAHFCDPKIDARIEQLADEEPTNPAGTFDLAAELDREITDQAPWVPLFTPRSIDVTSARVGNFQAQLGQVPLDQLWVR